jgi:hypothetical protein
MESKTMTEVANPTLGKIEDAVERFGLYALLQVGLGALFAAYPQLNFWPLAPFIKGLAEKLADKLFVFIRLVLDLNVIRFVNEQHQVTFERSVVSLKAIARGYGVDSDQFRKTRENAKTYFAQLVHFNGA